MYLTRFQINRVRRQARRMLGSPQVLHAAVSNAFPPQAPATTNEPTTTSRTGRVLWRVDDDGRHAVLYIVSPEQPDVTHLVEQAGWPTLHQRQQQWQTRDYSEFLEHLDTGQQWAFRLTANPTKSTRIGDSTRSQRIGHVTVAQQETWLLNRTDTLGIKIVPSGDAPALLIHNRNMRQFKRQGTTITISSATFDGRAEITDPDLLRAALTNGIGPAKAYGCGLMTLAPIKDRP